MGVQNFSIGGAHPSVDQAIAWPPSLNRYLSMKNKEPLS